MWPPRSARSATASTTCTRRTAASTRRTRPSTACSTSKKYTDEIKRSWIFRTVGYGNGESVWRDILSNLRLVGYDHVVSIEHEDSLMSGDEGLKKAIAFLKQIVIEAPAGTAYWA